MAYCRFGKDSDVYLYEDINGGWSCIWCELVSGGKISAANSHLDTIEATITHLREHIKCGHKVPDKAIAELEAEKAVSK
ncbi:MAG TPA: hypothetical protein EYP39_10555 [Ghiorsea sp.]|nr:hypothetical protein [Ghiorsea sp.]